MRILILVTATLSSAARARDRDMPVAITPYHDKKGVDVRTLAHMHMDHMHMDHNMPIHEDYQNTQIRLTIIYSRDEEQTV